MMACGKFDSVITVTRFSFPIQRALKINNERLSMIQPENLNKRSQDLDPTYHESGQFWWIATQALMERKTVLGDRTGAVVLEEGETQDIDTEEDWAMAELKYRSRMHQPGARC